MAFKNCVIIILFYPKFLKIILIWQDSLLQHSSMTKLLQQQALLFAPLNFQPQNCEQLANLPSFLSLSFSWLSLSLSLSLSLLSLPFSFLFVPLSLTLSLSLLRTISLPHSSLNFLFYQLIFVCAGEVPLNVWESYYLKKYYVKMCNICVR